MKILSADFITTAESKEHYPKGGMPELAFAGRSNVGKSSMINTLLGRRNLVRTSKTPGRTRQLNFFRINDSFVFVDLPGYGYARVPESMRMKWGPMVEDYLRERQELAGVVIIVDARRPPTDSDMVLIHYLRAHGRPMIVAATKADKLARGRMVLQQRLIEQQVGQDLGVVLFSSLSGQGKKELWKEIKSLIE